MDPSRTVWDLPGTPRDPQETPRTPDMAPQDLPETPKREPHASMQTPYYGSEGSGSRRDSGSIMVRIPDGLFLHRPSGDPSFGTSQGPPGDPQETPDPGPPRRATSVNIACMHPSCRLRTSGIYPASHVHHHPLHTTDRRIRAHRGPIP